VLKIRSLAKPLSVVRNSQTVGVKAMTLEEILKKYKAIQTAPFNPFSNAKLFDSFPHGTRRYKEQLLKLLETKISSQNPEDLGFYLALAHRDGMDEAYKPILKQLVLATWHDNHEDVVDYIAKFKDDDFTDDLYTIAITPEPYRQYDDEMEATLRKCVHALKAINSENSNKRLEQLESSGNDNVHYALEMYP
jgi:hypothetical protein